VLDNPHAGVINTYVNHEKMFVALDGSIDIQEGYWCFGVSSALHKNDLASFI